MIEIWRNFLYPIGFLGSFVFAGRFTLQWLVSESKKQSVVTKGFWTLSLIATGITYCHAMIQVQFHVCLIYGINFIIAWRNLNLLKSTDKHARFRTVISLMATVALCTATLFYIQGLLFYGGHTVWLRTPTYFWVEELPTPASLGWHIFGSVGICLFASRFWVQWWSIERHRESFLNRSFWWLSLIGASISVIYFYHLKDGVNALGPGLGLVMYVRNLMLLKGDRSPTIVTGKQ